MLRIEYISESNQKLKMEYINESSHKFCVCLSLKSKEVNTTSKV